MKNVAVMEDGIYPHQVAYPVVSYPFSARDSRHSVFKVPAFKVISYWTALDMRIDRYSATSFQQSLILLIADRAPR